MTTTVEPTTSRTRSVSGFVVQVVSWVVLLACVAAITVAVLVPRLIGATPYTVLTGSMVPTYPPGTLVVVKPINTDDLRVGDVVTYQITSGDPTVVTHRVVAISTKLDGERAFRTRGDANNAEDLNPVRPVQIKGTVVYAIPHLGRLNLIGSGHERQTAAMAVAGGLGIYALWMFGSAIVGRTTRQRQER